MQSFCIEYDGCIVMRLNSSQTVTMLSRKTIGNIKQVIVKCARVYKIGFRSSVLGIYSPSDLESFSKHHFNHCNNTFYVAILLTSTLYACTLFGFAIGSAITYFFGVAKMSKKQILVLCSTWSFLKYEQNRSISHHFQFNLNIPWCTIRYDLFQVLNNSTCILQIILNIAGYFSTRQVNYGIYLLIVTKLCSAIAQAPWFSVVIEVIKI